MTRGYRISVEFTNHCNFRCIYCPHATHPTVTRRGRLQIVNTQGVFDRPKGYISDETFELACAAVQRHAGYVQVGFFGEQVLHPKFNELMHALANLPGRRQRVFNSNWSTVTNEHLEAICRFDSVKISIDSTSAAAWEKMCPGGPVFGLDGAKGDDRHATLVEKTRVWLARRQRPVTDLIFVRQPDNEANEAAFVREWQPRLRRGDRIIAKAWLTYGGIMDHASMPQRQCTTYRERKIMIAWDGTVSPCNMDVNMAMCFGNLHEAPLETLLAAPAYASYVDAMRERRGICASCRDAQNHAQQVHGVVA